MGDTNTNYQTYNGNLPQGNFNYGQLVGLDQSMGLSAGNQPTFISNGNIYQVTDNGNNTFGLKQIDTVSNRQGEAAQQAYQQQIGSAVGGLQSQKANLAGQYGSLLQTVTGEYQPLINQTTATAGAAESARGLTPDSQLFQTQVQGALQPVYGAEAANAQQIGAGSISDVNTLTQAIASLQAGAAGTQSQLPLQYGSLSLAAALNPSAIAANFGQAASGAGQGAYYGGLNPNQLAMAKLQYGEPFSVQNGLIFNPSSGKFSQAGGGASDRMSLIASIISRKSSQQPQASNINQFVTPS